MRKLIFVIFILLFLTTAVYAENQTCQYTKEVVDSVESKFLPFDLSGAPLKEIMFEFDSEWNQPAKVINPNDLNLSVSIKLNINAKNDPWCPPHRRSQDQIITKELIIPASDFIEIPVEDPFNTRYCKNFRWTGVHEVQYQNTGPVYAELVEIEHKKEVCAGADDGAACTKPSECGGGYCVKGYCSNSETCFNNDCKCSAHEIQCSDNTRCVMKSIISLDNRPKCAMSEECITGYINPNSGLCAKSPSQLNAEADQRQEKEQARLDDIVDKEAEERKFMIYAAALIISLIIGGGIASYLIRLWAMKKGLEKIRYELQTKEEHLAELREKSRKTENEKARIKKLTKELEKKSKEYYFKLYSERYGNKIYLDKEGYFRFENKNTALHRYLYSKNEGPIGINEVIHHIDANLRNNELWNLIKLPRYSHGKKLTHARIPFGDWESGIEQLKSQLGLRDKDFPSAVRKHLREIQKKKK